MVCGQTCSTGKKGNLSGTSGARLRMGEGGGVVQVLHGLNSEGISTITSGGSEGVEFKNFRGGGSSGGGGVQVD